MTRPLAQILAEWAVGLGPFDPPPDVQRAARRAIYDTIGVMAAGRRHSTVEKLINGWPSAAGACTTVGGHLNDAETAAMINGVAAHAWDFDDTSYTGIMHGSAVILPAALALTEETGASERDMLTAFIAASEVTYVLADICTHQHYFRGWWSTVTFGLVGATAAAARLLGLTAEQTTHALGLALSSASGGKSVFGTGGKPFLVGDAARRAIGFARAAKLGVSGPAGAFEDDRGFRALLNDGEAELAEAETLGARWRLVDPGLLFKTNPVCSAAHAAIELMANLMREADATPSEITRIEAEIPKLVDVSLIYPRPLGPAEAQFSLPYAIACATLHGRVRLEDLSPPQIASEEKTALMERVTTTVASDLSTKEARTRHPESARLKLTLRNGRHIEGFCGEALGMPGRPLSNAEIQTKFADCLRFAGAASIGEETTQANLLQLAQNVLGPNGSEKLSQQGRLT